MSTRKTHEQFLIDFEKKQPDLFKAIELIGKFTKTTEKVLVKDKTINFVYTARELYGDLYDYSLVEYINAKSDIKIICNIHNIIFEVNPNEHLSKKGCPFCGNDRHKKFHQENATGWSWEAWEKSGLISKNFFVFQCYIIKCWNNEETFYKIGKTFVSVKERFRCKRRMPYNYEIIQVIKGTARTICELETRLKRENNEFKYIPKIKFGGMYECFTEIKDLDLLINN